MKLRQTLAILLVSTLLGTLLAPPFSVLLAQDTPAPQPPDNSEAVDIIADCTDTPEGELPKDPGDIFPPEFNVLPPDGYPPLLPAPVPFVPTPLGHIDWKIDSFGEMLDALGFTGAQFTEKPVLHVISSQFGGSEGDILSLTTDATNFSTSEEDLSYAWWNVRTVAGKEVLISLNGVVAGGREFRTLPATTGSRCGIATRNPVDENDTDTNRDGMGDRWEQQFFGTLSVNPQGDTDQDGVVVGSFVNRELEKTLSIVPNSRSSTNQNFVTGDGKFSNLEEYVWGTNPVDPDSDDDGYLDEQDVAGIGQAHLSYVPSDFAGTTFTIQVDTLGDSSFRGSDDNLIAQMTGVRVPYNVNNKENLVINVNPSNLNPDLGTTFQVEAEVFGTRTVAGLLKFSWRVSNKNIPFVLNLPTSPCRFKGFGEVLECTFEANSAASGDTIEFQATAEDPATGEKASENLSLPLGGSILLTTDPLLVPQFPLDRTGKVPPRPAGDEISGERWVALTAHVVGQNPALYRFRWKVDSAGQTETCATAPLTKNAVGRPVGMIPCGVGTPILYYHATSTNSHVYSVYVSVVQVSTGQPYGSAILPLFTDPTPSAVPNAVAAAPELLTYEKKTVTPGSTLTLHARSLEGNDQRTYEYQWMIDSETVANAPNAKSLSFTAQKNKKEYAVSLLVTEKERGVPVSRKQETVTIAVTSQSDFEAWKNTKLAALSSVAAPLTQTVAGNSSLLLLLLGGILIAGTLVFGGKTKGL